VPTVVPHGRWPSPLEAAAVAAGRTSRYELLSDGRALYWPESRPTEQGRVVLVRWQAGVLTDHSPPGSNLRSRVHQYGGGAVCLVPGHAPGAFAYVEATDQRVWFCDGPGAPPRALTAAPPAGAAWHHGGLGASADGAWVLAVREAFAGDPHAATADGPPVPVRTVVAFPVVAAEATAGAAEPPPASTLCGGHDFYGTPHLDPDGTRCAVVAWDHPDMPWDAGHLLVVPLTTDGARLVPDGDPFEVAGGPTESVGQPAWRPDGTLRFVSDRAGWWQPYVHAGCPDPAPPVPLTDQPAEFHSADWALSLATMADFPDGRLVAAMTSDGTTQLVTLATDAPAPAPIDQPCVFLPAVVAHGPGVAFLGTAPSEPANVWLIDDLTHAGSPAPLLPTSRTSSTAIRPGDIAATEPIHLTGSSGRAIFGTLYRPALTDTAGPPGQAPPLIVFVHGGPTGSATPGLDLTRHFFTSRGFAVVTVDYAGSDGYGRDFRRSLWGEWGVADAEDCLDMARALAARGDVDPHRLAIRGTSSGGLTALNACRIGAAATAPGFKAVVAWSGVTDLVAQAANTHDFEARYTDRLIGPLPAALTRYQERSPVHHADELAASGAAVLLLQGTEDPIVPAAQASALRDAITAAGGHCELLLFEGEGHGFRQAGSMTMALETELAFYQRILDL
jgi:dipeptidyl aminopeptidase/acylaminoacyl peptidase